MESQPQEREAIEKLMLTEKALRKTKHWIMPSIVSPVKQNVPVRWRPFRPTADANEACTRALRPAAATVPPCMSTMDARDEDDDDDEDVEEDEEEEAAVSVTARATLFGNGAVRINRSSESILTPLLHTFLLSTLLANGGNKNPSQHGHWHHQLFIHTFNSPLASYRTIRTTHIHNCAI